MAAFRDIRAIQTPDNPFRQSSQRGRRVCHRASPVSYNKGEGRRLTNNWVFSCPVICGVLRIILDMASAPTWDQVWADLKHGMVP